MFLSGLQKSAKLLKLNMDISDIDSFGKTVYMENKGTMIQDFTTGSVSRQLLSFAAPLVMSGLLQTVYNMVDMIVVGRYVGSAGLSAVSVGGEVLMMLTFIATGISNAGQVTIAQFIGAGKKDMVSRMVGTLFTFLLICALGMTVVCTLIRENILQWINMPMEAYDHGLDYLTTCIFGLVFIYGYNLVSAVLRGMGDSKRPFIIIAIAAVLNLILDMVFVAGFGMAAFGAALATVISQAISFICALVYLYHHREQFGFDFKPSSFGIFPDAFKPLIKLGIPMMLQSASITFSKLFISSWVNTYGVVASALTGIGHKLATITNIIAQAFSTAGGSMIAQNIGAEKYERVPRVIGTSMVMDGIVSIALCAVTLLWPRVVFGLFTSEAAVLDMATIYLPVAVLTYLGAMFRGPMMSLINGSGNFKLNISIAVLDGILMRIGFAMFLGLVCNMGIKGFWYGDALSGFMPFVIGGVYYISGNWKTRSSIIKDR